MLLKSTALRSVPHPRLRREWGTPIVFGTRLACSIAAESRRDETTIAQRLIAGNVTPTQRRVP